MKDITRYFLEDVEGTYTEEQLDKVLSEFGYDEFPSGGLNDKGLRILNKRLAEVDKAESNLTRVKKKDLSSKIVGAKSVKVKGEKSRGCLSAVGEDFKKAVKGVGTYSIMTLLALPSCFRKTHEERKWNEVPHSLIFVYGNFAYFLTEIISSAVNSGEFNRKRILTILGIELGTNLASGLYEYVRHVKKRVNK